MESKLAAVFSGGLKVDVTALCRELDISRQSFYKYRRRWAEEGPPGLAERSRRPHSSPSQVSAEVEEAVVRLRKELPLDNGAQTIAYHLARRGLLVPSVATVHRVLVRRGMVVPQPDKRPRSSWRRFEWPRPNDAWQVDATAWALADGREVWVMDVLDDHSRLLVAARACDGPTGEAAWDALAHGAAERGVPARVMSDNGLCFTGRFHGAEVAFERTLRSLGVVHLRSAPGHPQTCGKIERSHQTTKRRLSTLPPARDAGELQAQLDDWRECYNRERPHKALGGLTPLERWAASEPAVAGGPLPGPPRASLHVVSTAGHIGWSSHLVAVDTRLAGQRVLVVARDDEVSVHGPGGYLRRFTVDRTRRYQPNGEPPGPKSRR